jgi:outer membrane biosynthesis protein TonB
VKGNPMLASAASTAVKKWRFTPFTVEGNPAKAVARLEFEFAP